MSLYESDLTSSTYAGVNALADELQIDLVAGGPTTGRLAFEGELGSVALLHSKSRSLFSVSGMESIVTLYGEDALPEAEQIEARLVGQFLDLVLEVDANLPKIMEPVKDREVKDAESFAITPIVVYESEKPARGRSTDIYGDGIPIDPLLTDKYLGSQYYRITLDSRYAIGLDYCQEIIALAAAGIDSDGNLFINQIQGANIVQRRRGLEGMKQFNESGLNHGFLWRHTLVNAWVEVARSIDCHAVVIQSHKNSEWPSIQVRGESGYDAVANDLGFKQQDDKNWKLVL